MNEVDQEALNTAWCLFDLGVPIFRARPCPGETCRRRGHGPETDYDLPANWQRTKPEAGRQAITDWRPGDGLGAVMGHVFDAIDIDPRNGGVESLLAAFTLYGVQRTPRGGVHGLIMPLGVGKHTSVLPGVDLQGGKPDGTGRGFIWIAPTVRHGSAYRWTSPAVHHPDHDDRSGDWLRNLILKPERQHHPVVAPASVDPPPPGYLERFWEDVQAYEESPDGSAGDTVLFRLACRVREFANAGWLDLDAGLERLDDARVARCAHTLGQSEADWQRVLGSSQRAVGGRSAHRSEREPLKVNGVPIEGVVPPKADASGVASSDSPAAGPGAPVNESTTWDDNAEPLELEWASEREPEAPRWFWHRYIPLASLSVISGKPGIGKSSIGYDLTASLTRGVLPGELHGQPRKVLVVATEDHWTQAVLPRLLAAKADRSMVARVRPRSIKIGQSGELMLPEDLSRLRKTIIQHKIGLVLLDPLMSRLGKLDTNNDAEVRKALEPVKALGEETGATFLGVIHNKKDTKEIDPQHAVMGSVAFTAVPRSVLMAHVDRENPEQRYMTLAKSNAGPISPMTPALAYRMTEMEVGKDPHDGRPIRMTKIVWEGERELSTADLLNVQQGRRVDDGIVAWIAEQGRPVSRQEVLAYAQTKGIGRSVVDDRLRMAVPELLKQPRHGLYQAVGK